VIPGVNKNNNNNNKIKETKIICVLNDDSFLPKFGGGLYPILLHLNNLIDVGIQTITRVYTRDLKIQYF